MSNGGFSDALRDIDHPDETITKIPIKTEITLTLIKILKVLSLSLGLTHSLLRRSLYTEMLLNLIRVLYTNVAHKSDVVTSLTYR